MAEQNYTISDIIETYISGDWGNDEPTEDASCPVSCIRGADIVPIYNSEYNNIPLRYISEKSLSNRALQEGDIVIEKSGGSPTQSTGRVVYISKELLEEKQDIVCSNFCAAFRIKPEWDAKYVYYYLQHVYPTFPHQHITRLCFLAPEHPWRSRYPVASRGFHRYKGLCLVA